MNLSGLNLSSEQLAALGAIALGMQAGSKAVTPPPNATYLHGAGGLLATLGANPNIMNAMIMPRGLAGAIPRRKSVYANELFGVLTGLTASTGAEPTTACADGTQAGNFKLCYQTVPFGRTVKETKVLQLDRLGELINHCETIDARVFGDPFGSALQSDVLRLSPRDILRSEVSKNLSELYASIVRDYADDFWTGNPANTPGSTGYLQHFGLDFLIDDGYRDASTGVVCPAADSYVATFASANIATNAQTTLSAITNIWYELQYRADRMGYGDQVTTTLVMPHGLFRALTAIWPCVYATDTCAVVAGDGERVNVNGMDAIALRDSMRMNNYLLIEGRQVPVITDDSIPVTEVVGPPVERESTIYFVPLGNVGGEPTLYWEHFDMANQMLTEALGTIAPANHYKLLANGTYLLHMKPPTNECIQARIVTRPRLILRTPFLAAKLTNVRWTQSIIERSPFPGAASYVNGGQTGYVAPTYSTPHA